MRARRGLPHAIWLGHGARVTTTEESERERRWVVVAAAADGQAPDGRYVTLGRHSDPTEEEIRAAEEALRSQGLAGYLAVMEGNPWVGPLPRLMEVRALANPAGPFAEVAPACVETIRLSRERARC